MLELFELAIIFNNPIVLLFMMMLLLLVMLRYGLLRTLRFGDSWLTLSGQLAAFLKGFRRLLLFFYLKSYKEIPTSWTAIVVATSVIDPWTTS